MPSHHRTLKFEKLIASEEQSIADGSARLEKDAILLEELGKRVQDRAMKLREAKYHQNTLRHMQQRVDQEIATIGKDQSAVSEASLLIRQNFEGMEMWLRDRQLDLIRYKQEQSKWGLDDKREKELKMKERKVEEEKWVQFRRNEELLVRSEQLRKKEERLEEKRKKFKEEVERREEEEKKEKERKATQENSKAQGAELQAARNKLAEDTRGILSLHARLTDYRQDQERQLSDQKAEFEQMKEAFEKEEATWREMTESSAEKQRKAESILEVRSQRIDEIYRGKDAMILEKMLPEVEAEMAKCLTRGNAGGYADLTAASMNFVSSLIAMRDQRKNLPIMTLRKEKQVVESRVAAGLSPSSLREGSRSIANDAVKDLGASLSQDIQNTPPSNDITTVPDNDTPPTHRLNDSPNLDMRIASKKRPSPGGGLCMQRRKK